MQQNLQKFAEFQKIQLDNLVDFEKCCKTRILNYFLAKIGANTAENERNFGQILPKIGNYPTGPWRAPCPPSPALPSLKPAVQCCVQPGPGIFHVAYLKIHTTLRNRIDPHTARQRSLGQALAVSRETSSRDLLALFGRGLRGARLRGLMLADRRAVSTGTRQEKANLGSRYHIVYASLEKKRKRDFKLFYD